MQAAIVLFDGYTALDALGPYQVLAHTPGVEVVLVAERAGTVDDNARLQVTAHAALAEVTRPDVVVVPGGLAAITMARGPHPVVDWIAAVHPHAAWTTSVCTGAHLLGAAGLLRGRRATTHWYTRDQLTSFGATPVDDRVVIDGTVITAAGVSAGLDMALTLAARLAGTRTAQMLQLDLEYDPRPPFTAGTPATAPPDVRDELAARYAHHLDQLTTPGTTISR